MGTQWENIFLFLAVVFALPPKTPCTAVTNQHKSAPEGAGGQGCMSYILLSLRITTLTYRVILLLWV